MRRLLIWSFERGSFHYDIMCGLILAFIFITPKVAFDDRPDYMRLSEARITSKADKSGNQILTVKLNAPVFINSEAARMEALKALEETLGSPIKASKMQPIYDWADQIVAYAVWLER
jgi:hypothetical protein